MPTFLSNVGGLVKQKIEAFIMREITLSASNFAETVKNNASWSSKIPNAIEVSEAQTDGNGRFWIDVKVDLEKAPMARAFEWGSGIHAEKGNKGKYRIPKEGYGLAFEWDKVDETSKTGRKFRGILPDGRAGFTFVEHPGVAPRPYLAPAIESNRKTLRERLLKAFVGGYRDAVVRVEFIKPD